MLPIAIREVEHAIRDVAAAEERMQAVIRHQFPPGTTVTWMHRGEFLQTGIVSDAIHFRRELRVINAKTGNHIWLKVGRLKYMSLPDPK